MQRHLELSISLLALLCLAGCNAGLAGLFAASEDDSPPSNSPAAVTAFTVKDTEENPARVRFQVVDADGDAANLSFFYQVPGGPVQGMEQLEGVPTDDTFPGSAAGVSHELTWNFTSEADLPLDGSYVPGVLVWAQRPGTSVITPGANASVGGIGNDPPTVDAIDEPTSESVGITLVGLTLSDSSADLLSLRVEYEIAGSDEWHLARPAGEDVTPEFAVVGLSAPADGIDINFFWDTTHDLPLLESDVRLRFTPVDPTISGEVYVSDVFAIDNNDESTVVLDNGLIAYDATDRTGGIALPFTVADQERDDIRVVFQWRRPGQVFPALPTNDPDAVFAIQDDPVLRAQYQVCSERVSYMTGRPRAVDANHVRLPELGTSLVPVATPEFVDRDLEILRPIARETDVTASWSSPLPTNPVAIQPLGDGLEAWVLDSPAAGSWRLRRLVLATGEVVEELVNSIGDATAMSTSPTGERLVVASSNGNDWRVDLISAIDGTLLGSVDGTAVSSDGIRGVAGLSEQTAALTVDDTLLQVNFATSVARELFDGLATPWGVALDPTQRNSVLVAEHDTDRILALDILHGIRRELALPSATPGPGTPAFNAPRAIAIDRSGSRLLVIAESGSTGRELLALNRFSPHDLDGDTLADLFTYSMAELGAGTGAHIGIGPENLRVTADRTSGQIIALGGIEQRRRIVEAPPTTNVVTLDRDLEPLLSEPRTWRVKRSPARFKSTELGRTHTFPWDSSDLIGGGEVLFRAYPFDSELGLPSETAIERVLVDEQGLRRTTIDPGTPDTIAYPSMVDLDRDGDWDVLISDGAQSRFVIQEGPGVFNPTPIPLNVVLEHSMPTPLLLEDLDADGHLDLIHYRDDQEIEVFRGTGVNAFDPTPEVLAIPGLPQTLDFYVQLSMLVADVDGDRILDLVVTVPNETVPGPGEMSNFVAIYLQDQTHSFSQPPIIVGGYGESDYPRFVALGDVDGNGLLDMATANAGFQDLDIGPHYDTGHLLVYFQEQPGVFDPLPFKLGEFQVEGTFTTANTVAIELADMDEDGDLDLVASHEKHTSGFSGQTFPRHTQELTIFWQNELGEFDVEPLVLGSPKARESHLASFVSVKVQDMNRDGYPDVVAHNLVGMFVWYGLGQGNYAPTPTHYETRSSTVLSQDTRPSTHALLPIDIEGDGDLDVVYLDHLSYEIEVAFGIDKGIEVFTDTPLVVDPGAGGLWDVVVSDVDSDGDLDVSGSAGGILGNNASAQLELMRQNAPRSFSSEALGLGGLPTMQFPSRIEAADMDQDGDRDMLGVSTTTNEVQIYFQESPGIYGPPSKFEGAETGVNPLFNALLSLEVADLDDDGDLEFLTAAGWYETFFGFDQVSPGVFQQGFRIDNFEAGMEVYTFPRDLASADLDGDGDNELLVVTGTAADLNTLLIFDGTGPFQYDPTPQVLPNGGCLTVEVADLDGDGDLDIITTGELFGGPLARIFLHYRNDEGTYDSVQLNHNMTGASIQVTGPNLRLADFDGDGDLDIFALLNGVVVIPGSLSVIEQIAPGVFATSPTITVAGPGGQGFALRVEDIDGDGELDAALPTFVSGVGSGHMTLLWGND